MDKNLEDFGGNFCPKNYLEIALNARRNQNKKFRILLEKGKIPEVGWDDSEIEEFIHTLSTLDSNNFQNKCGLGEREGRFACNLVAKRHYNLCHGIGRSGDILEAQPKAAGSTLLSNLTNSLLLELIRFQGVRNAKLCFIVPMATGMTLSLCLLSLKKLKPNSKYVLWSRIDQKACFKSITTTGLIPIIIEPIENNFSLSTNILQFEQQIQKHGIDQILAIFSTTSCFAPRNCDDIIELSKIAKKNNLFHLVNNAYGLQSSYLCHQIEQANKLGKLDLFVQSTDKNLMVPVGGAIVSGFQEDMVQCVARNYVGRGSLSPSLDCLMTLLSLGCTGYQDLVTKRKQLFSYLKTKLITLAEKHSEIVIETKNPISLAMTLRNFKQEENDANITKLGSMLFIRGVSGTRIITKASCKEIDSFKFQSWGSHKRLNEIPYITAAVSLGCEEKEIDTFIEKLNKCYYNPTHINKSK